MDRKDHREVAINFYLNKIKKYKIWFDETNIADDYSNIQHQVSVFQTFITSKRLPLDIQSLDTLVECCRNYVLLLLNALLKADDVYNLEIKQKFREDLDIITKIIDPEENPDLNFAFVEKITKPLFEFVTDPCLTHVCGKELLSTYNTLIVPLKSSLRKQILRDDQLWIYSLVDTVVSCGEYEFQSVIIETVFRLSDKDRLQSVVPLFFPERVDFQKLFLKISANTFDIDLRYFLNAINATHKNIFSIECLRVILGTNEIQPPNGFNKSKSTNLWIDFNTLRKNESISIICDTLDNLLDSQCDEWEMFIIYARDVIEATVSRFESKKRMKNNYFLLNILTGKQLSYIKESSKEIANSRNATFIIEDNDRSKELIDAILVRFFGSKYKNLLVKSGRISRSLDSTYKDKTRHVSPAYKPLQTVSYRNMSCPSLKYRGRSLKSDLALSDSSPSATTTRRDISSPLAIEIFTDQPNLEKPSTTNQYSESLPIPILNLLSSVEDNDNDTNQNKLQSKTPSINPTTHLISTEELVAINLDKISKMIAVKEKRPKEVIKVKFPFMKRRSKLSSICSSLSLNSIEEEGVGNMFSPEKGYTSTPKEDKVKYLYSSDVFYSFDDSETNKISQCVDKKEKSTVLESSTITSTIGESKASTTFVRYQSGEHFQDLLVRSEYFPKKTSTLKKSNNTEEIIADKGNIDVISPPKSNKMKGFLSQETETVITKNTSVLIEKSESQCSNVTYFISRENLTDCVAEIEAAADSILKESIIDVEEKVSQGKDKKKSKKKTKNVRDNNPAKGSSSNRADISSILNLASQESSIEKLDEKSVNQNFNEKCSTVVEPKISQKIATMRKKMNDNLASSQNDIVINEEEIKQCTSKKNVIEKTASQSSVSCRKFSQEISPNDNDVMEEMIETNLNNEAFLVDHSKLYSDNEDIPMINARESNSISSMSLHEICTQSVKTKKISKSKVIDDTTKSIKSPEVNPSDTDNINKGDLIGNKSKTKNKRQKNKNKKLDQVINEDLIDDPLENIIVKDDDKNCEFNNKENENISNLDTELKKVGKKSLKTKHIKRKDKKNKVTNCSEILEPNSDSKLDKHISSQDTVVLNKTTENTHNNIKLDDEVVLQKKSKRIKKKIVIHQNVVISKSGVIDDVEIIKSPIELAPIVESSHVNNNEEVSQTEESSLQLLSPKYKSSPIQRERYAERISNVGDSALLFENNYDDLSSVPRIDSQVNKDQENQDKMIVDLPVEIEENNVGNSELLNDLPVVDVQETDFENDVSDLISHEVSDQQKQKELEGSVSKLIPQKIDDESAVKKNVTSVMLDPRFRYNRIMETYKEIVDNQSYKTASTRVSTPRRISESDRVSISSRLSTTTRSSKKKRNFYDPDDLSHIDEIACGITNSPTVSTLSRSTSVKNFKRISTQKITKRRKTVTKQTGIASEMGDSLSNTGTTAIDIFNVSRDGEIGQQNEEESLVEISRNVHQEDNRILPVKEICKNDIVEISDKGCLTSDPMLNEVQESGEKTISGINLVEISTNLSQKDSKIEVCQKDIVESVNQVEYRKSQEITSNKTIDKIVKTGKKSRKTSTRKKVAIPKINSKITVDCVDKKSTLNKRGRKSGKDKTNATLPKSHNIKRKEKSTTDSPRKKFKVDYAAVEDSFESVFNSLGDALLKRLALKKIQQSKIPKKPEKKKYSFVTEFTINGANASNRTDNDSFSQVLKDYEKDKAMEAAMKACNEKNGFCIYKCNDIMEKRMEYQKSDASRDIARTRSFFATITDQVLFNRQNLEESDKSSIEFKTCTKLYQTMHTYYHSEIFNQK